MRPIKFRAWHKDLKIMREVSVINFDHNEVVINRKESEFDHANFISKSTWFEGTFELMQFTGLYDRNGKEIYEGDILRFFEPGNMWEGESCEEGIIIVTWNSENLQWYANCVDQENIALCEIDTQ